ncbi:hypothetical protein FVA74_05980 [Salinibacterium sp. dk2585]|nr:hypothetical protein FVA74_05980 [Salinibacterium sp. dk2585]TXK54182.1 hypothetical protein FVP63_07430 [Salinibacterium sp. dk5596]
MPELPRWLASNAPARTRRLFTEYLAARDISEIPVSWIDSHYDNPGPVAEPLVGDPSEPTPAVPITSLPVDADTKRVDGETTASKPPTTRPKLFIVHGHDEAARDSIRIYVHGLTGVMPTSLAEEAGNGATIIEKFEKHGSDTSFVIVLLTPDDVGQTVAAHEAGAAPNPRARQNVVLELGYFIGRVGRDKIVVVNADVERPSDLAGLSYVEYPGTNWKDALRVELKGAGLTS